MTKRKVKEELKKPDFMMIALERATAWTKEHARLCITVLSAVIVIAAGTAGYRMYESREDNRLQYQLGEGITAYQEYTTSGSSQALRKAESSFKAVSASRHKDLDEVAKLYLAKICHAQGKNEDARSLYLDVKSRTSSSILRSLAETALQRLGQPVK